MGLRGGMRLGLVLALLASAVVPLPGTSASAVTLPTGFGEQVVFSGLDKPTNIEFAPDGRIFVAEQGGRIKVFSDLADPTPTVFADLSTVVHHQWDRGLLGLALPPGFPADPWVYVLYTYDAPPGQTAPYWNDTCGNANNGQCVATGRLSRLRAGGDVMTGAEQVLISDWCQQYPSHSVGDLHFGADGMLYATAGDGASFNSVDYGQLGSPANPCGDPPGGTMTPPTAEGGALRAQDVRSTADPTGLNGAVLRLDPATGAAAPGNPLIGAADPNARRIVGHGTRNAFRFTIRPGTNEIWLGDVGWRTWEEINRIVDPTAGVTNFGWPCYEGASRMGSYDNANLNLCEQLYSAGGHTAPYYGYHHSAEVVSGENCGSGGDAVTGLAFYPGSGGSYPAAYAGALFFADYSRGCIWAMRPNSPGGLPNRADIEAFGQAAAAPVDLAIGPGGELYYADVTGGTVRRIRYFPGNQPPTAVISATPTSGPTPLTVTFDGTASVDPDPADAGRLRYRWDFTSDGTVDATGPTATFRYPDAGRYTATLTVVDTLDATASGTVTIQPGNSAPTALLDAPVLGTTWRVGDTLDFAGRATDPQQGDLPASALRWRLRMEHCESVGNCHTHHLQEWSGVAAGSFVAPDHEYPSYLELELTATDGQGLSNTVVRRLDPRTVDLTFASNPPGLRLSVGAITGTAPFTRTVIVGSTNTVSAPSPQTAGRSGYVFADWSDGEAATHVITAPATATTYTATYTDAPGCGAVPGYSCETETGQPWRQAGTVLPLAGDDVVTPVDLPFPVPFFGRTYRTAWISTNGFVSFADPGHSRPSNSALPVTGPPNAGIYPFWDDLYVRADSSVRTTVTGTAPDRRFVVEWRNVGMYGFVSARISFEAVVAENGEIVFNYADLDGTGRERGSAATVGIEDPPGTAGLQFSFNRAALTNGTSILFQPNGQPPLVVDRSPDRQPSLPGRRPR
ncbi:PQQ-dependent sugar dehydrogenase [Plantactinospora sp. WMMB334]|uniref:PQQ-dependent sugar dehydrogenase n=1 Tax=Plantactinospora sp. WMMB334 TaxID=3404119 RepID=UPI003B937684